MVIVPNRFIYLAAPRTGSRTTCDALVQHCGGIKEGREHHSKLDELQALETDPSERLPVYSVIREPFDFVMSSWARAYDPTMRDFLDNWNPDALGEWEGRMTPYEGFVTHYFLFENGLEDLFARWGFPDTPLGHQGRYETPPYHPVSPADEDLVRERFPVDFKRYEHWRLANSVL
jgi:hypothetical protein